MATNKVYQVDGTPVTLNTDGFANLANNSGAFTPFVDLGASPRPHTYRWRVTANPDAAVAAGVGSLNVYFATSENNNNTDADGNLNNAGGALAAAGTTIAANLKFAGAVIPDTAANQTPLISSGVVTLRQRYVSMAWVNLLGQKIMNNATKVAVALVPVSDDIQAAA